MKFLLTVLLICLSVVTHSQSSVLLPGDYLKNKIASGKTFSESETRRFADLGRLWGILNYFHPKLYTGSLTTDSIALQPARILISDPSATGFRKAVNKMLELVDDPSTELPGLEQSKPSLLFLQGKAAFRVALLPDSTFFLALPPASFGQINENASGEKLMIGNFETAKAVIIDIRNAQPPGAYDEYQFMYDLLPVLTEMIAGSNSIPSLFERRVFHNGFVPQASTTPNIYSSGWQVTAPDKQISSTHKSPLNKPLAIIYNRYTHTDIIKQILVLRAAGLCRLIYEGAANSYSLGNREQVLLADSLLVSVRISDFLLAGDRSLPAPDLSIDRITDTALNGKFIQQVKALLRDATLSTVVKASDDPSPFILPKPNRYADTLVPSADQRLFGLYNFWNAIQYFSPYKESLDHSWDSIIYKYVPIFLNADDSLSYMLAVRSLASETQDCHGFVSNIRPASPARKVYGAWPPVQLGIINGKTYIIEMAKDSMQDLSQMNIGDEVTHIDGHSIEFLKKQWRSYIATSNENTYDRDIANYLATGPLDSEIELTVLKNKKPLHISLKRNGRWNLGGGIMNFNKKHTAAEWLLGNIAYINMGSLKSAMVDSVLNAFSKAKAIIFDIRNYPQGTAWSIAPHLTDKMKKAVIFDKPYVNNDYVRGGEDKSSMKSAFTVMPATGAPYKGKLIILCDRNTQSQAEYSIMMFQGAANVTVIGNQTAGADGNVTDVALPGGYAVSFSGLGIYYPDGTPTQRRGIKIDIKLNPSIAGLIAGKDEMLERAVRFINTGK